MSFSKFKRNEVTSKVFSKTREKGFIITVDSFISVLLVLVFVIISFFYLSKVDLNAWNTIDIRNSAFDEASVLEKSLALENSIKESSSEQLLESLNSTPNSSCFEATIYDSTMSAPLVHAIKTGCVKNSRDVFSVKRSFAVRSSSGVSFYIAKIDVWGRA